MLVLVTTRVIASRRIYEFGFGLGFRATRRRRALTLRLQFA